MKRQLGENDLFFKLWARLCTENFPVPAGCLLWLQTGVSHSLAVWLKKLKKDAKRPLAMIISLYVFLCKGAMHFRSNQRSIRNRTSVANRSRACCSIGSGAWEKQTNNLNFISNMPMSSCQLKTPWESVPNFPWARKDKCAPNVNFGMEKFDLEKEAQLSHNGQVICLGS